MSEYDYQFSGKLVHYGMSALVFTVVFIPRKITSQLEFGRHKRLRVDGEINGVRFELAIVPSKGKWYLLISERLQKLCGLSLGDTADIQFDVADQDAVHVPEELQFALEANEQALKAWDGWTPGKRHGFCYRVDSAKRAETRERRVEEVINALLEDQ